MAVSMDSGGPSPRMALKAMPCMFQYCILNALSYILEDTWVHPAEIDTSQLRPHHQPCVLVPWFFAAAEFNNLLTVLISPTIIPKENKATHSYFVVFKGAS